MIDIELISENFPDDISKRLEKRILEVLQKYSINGKTPIDSNNITNIIADVASASFLFALDNVEESLQKIYQSTD